MADRRVAPDASITSALPESTNATARDIEVVPIGWYVALSTSDRLGISVEDTFTLVLGVARDARTKRSACAPELWGHTEM